jgi:hypothetical protein
MNNIKRSILSLSAILILFIFIDEGRTMSLIVNRIQIHLNHNQTSDTEIPHQNNLDKSDDDKWMNSLSFGLADLSEMVLLIPCYHHISTDDYSVSVWQPPKFF